MAFLEKLIFYFVLALAIVIFLKLDKRHSFVTRIGIAIVVVLVLLLLFLFISAILGIVLVVVLIVVLVSFLEGKGFKFSKYKKK